VHLEVSGEERYARGVEQAIYRIMQEALNNVSSIAGACNVAMCSISSLIERPCAWSTTAPASILRCLSRRTGATSA